MLGERGARLPWEMTSEGQKEFNRRFNSELLLPFGKHLRNPVAKKKLKSHHWVMLCSEVSIYLLEGLIGDLQLKTLRNFIDKAELLLLNLTVEVDAIEDASFALMRAAEELARAWPSIVCTRVLHSVVCHGGDSVKMIGPGPLLSMWASESGFGSVVRALKGTTNLEQEIQNNEVVKLVGVISKANGGLNAAPRKFCTDIVLRNPSRWRDRASNDTLLCVIHDALTQMFTPYAIMVTSFVDNGGCSTDVQGFEEWEIPTDIEGKVERRCRHIGLRWGSKEVKSLLNTAHVRVATVCDWMGLVVRADPDADSELRDFSVKSRRTAVSCLFGLNEVERVGVPVLFYEVRVQGIRDECPRGTCFVKVRWCHEARESDYSVGGILHLRKEGNESFTSLTKMDDLEDVEQTLCGSNKPGYDFALVRFPKRLSKESD